MPAFGKSSLRQIKTLHPKWREILYLAIEMYDFSVISGYRNKAEQNRLYELGFSKTTYPDSKHNTNPSLAVDLAPWPIDWEDDARSYFLAGLIFAVAYTCDVKIRWGGDWDQDGDLHDQSFMDLGHFELLIQEEDE